ncbi:MAG: hypothetical protein Q8P88_00550 [Candidatus Jorgensenbacteria bacterium]|nr:hypothetical protein [Candidatus Jorgensenbacteria bacterium]
MGKLLKCGDCGYTGDGHEFIDADTSEQRCPKDGSTFVGSPAEIERLKHGGKPGEPTKRRKHVAA